MTKNQTHDNQEASSQEASGKGEALRIVVEHSEIKKDFCQKLATPQTLVAVDIKIERGCRKKNLGELSGKGVALCGL